MAYINGRKTFDVIRTVELSPVLLFNIVYSTSEPSDITKIWVKTNTTPSKLLLQQYVETTESCQTISAELPRTMVYTTNGVVGRYIYIFGGQNKAIGTVNEISRFDSASETLTTLTTTLPTSADAMGIGVVGTDIYLFGGYNYELSNPTYLDTIYKFDTTNNTITTLSPTLPSSMGYIATGVVGTDIYLFGGTTGSYSNKIYKFDTTTNTLTTIATTLQTTGFMTSGVVGTTVYLFGRTYTQKFDTTNNTITKIANNPYYQTTGVIDTDIYLFGVTTTIRKYDTTSDTITVLDITLPAPQGMTGMTSGVVGGNIYLFGGANEPVWYSRIVKFSSSALVVPRNNLLMLTNYSGEVLWIIDTEQLHISLPIYDAYIGNSSNVGEQVKVAIYQEGVGWVEVN